MKVTALSLLLFALGMHLETQKPPGFKPVAVLELFTSEGCSSCPPADALLAKLISETKAKGQNVFVLAFHVDYWNRLGWHDAFSSNDFTQRQRLYANTLGSSVYTPQLVVDGSKEMVGSNRAEVQKAIDEALKTVPLASFTELRLEKASDKSWKVNYQLDGQFEDCDIQLALVLKEAKTEVKRGENGGRTLHHSNVVQRFVTAQANKTGSIEMDLVSIQDKSNLTLIVFVQNRKTLKISAASQFEF